MAIDTVASFVEQIRQSRLLEPPQLDELVKVLQPRFSDCRSLAGHLIKKNWLTPYQVNQLLQGQGGSLALGQYRVLERIGEGGMGQVFKARHQAMGRIVALKVIRKERLENDTAVKRFFREIRAVGQLNHPNVVLALDADQVGGTHFFAMEYVEGADLSKLIKEKGPLPVALACEYIRQAALGLHHAHERGMVHRDIKPGNLLLTYDGGGSNGNSTSSLRLKKSAPKPVVKILDMGLARLSVAHGEATGTSLSVDGSVMGTPDYMAPEQAKNAHSVDHRADIYSLGCTLYLLLTGQVPFPGGSNIEKLLKHQMDEPRPVEQYRADIPPGLRTVLQKMMAKRPEDRLQTGAETAAALAPYCDASGAEAPAPVFVTGKRDASGNTTAKIGTRQTRQTTASATIPEAKLASAARRKPRGRRKLVLAGLGLVLLLGTFLMLRSLFSSPAAGKTQPGSSTAALASGKVPPPPPPPTSPENRPAIEPIQRYLPPDSNLVMLFKVRDFYASRAYAQHQQAVDANLAGLRLNLQNLGIDLSRNVERAAMAIAGEGNSFSPECWIYQGNFDPKSYHQGARRAGYTRVQKPARSEIYEVPNARNPARPTLMTLINSSILVLSQDRNHVLHAVNQGGGANPSFLKDRDAQRVLDNLDDRATFALVLGGSYPWGTSNGPKPMIDGLGMRSIQCGFLVANEVAVRLAFEAKDEMTAQVTQQHIQKGPLAALASRKDLGPMINLLATLLLEPTPTVNNRMVLIQRRFTPNEVNILLSGGQ